MPANRNALIRYKTIDNCLQNHYRKWTLEDLIDACSDALYEYEGIDKGISKRSIQMDIQLMRSEKLGYNAPIVVYESKYYKYEDKNFSITQAPLNGEDLKIMAEAVEVLRQFKAFGHFSEMSDLVSKLEDYVTSAKRKTTAVIDFEKNDDLHGLVYLDTIYQAIVNKQVLQVTYQSFKAHDENKYLLYPYLLKEYRNRWFVFAVLKDSQTLVNFALDRVKEIQLAVGELYVENRVFDPSTFFDDVVGVTKHPNMKVQKVVFEAARSLAPYILTKPIHKSQIVVEQCEDGRMIFQIEVIINRELESVFFGFSDGVTILQPRNLLRALHRGLKKAAENYRTRE